MGNRDRIDRTKNNAEQLHGVFSWDIVENIVRGDSVFARLYGLDPDIVDRGVPVETLLERIAPEDLARVAQCTHQSIVAGVPVDQTFSICRPGGDTIRVKVYSNCFHNVGGVMTHCAGSVYCTDSAWAAANGAETRRDNVLSVFSQHARKANHSNSNTMVAPELLTPK